MARQASGAITLVDVTDGTNPVSAFLTNENHTFSASAGGNVATAERTGFTSDVNVFLGSTQLTPIANNTTPTTGRFRVLAVGTNVNNNSVATGTGWTFAVDTDATPTIRLSAISDTSADTASLSVRVQYHDGNDANNFLNLTLTVSKVRQGAGGVVVTLAPTKQTFFSNNAGTLDTGAPNSTDVQINVNTVGTTGTLTIQTSQNGGAFTNQSATSNAAGGIAGYNLDQSSTQLTGNFPGGITNGTDSSFSLFIDANNLGNANNTLAVRVTAGNGGGDTVTIVKVREGAAGADAIIVVVESSNDTVFRTGESNPAKTLTCRVYDASTGGELTDGNIIYTWSRSGSGSIAAGAVRIGAGNRNVQDSGGRVANQNRTNGGATIVVGDEDVANREQFTCVASGVA